MPRRPTIALLTAGGIFLWGCSKTQDTAPATRIFGSPPVIQSVTLDNSSTNGQASCDFSDIVKQKLCDQGGVPPDQLNPFVMDINTTYTEAKFLVKVTDAESTPAATDILLVSASYVTTQGTRPTEVSLVILDDGGSNSFNFLQKSDTEENCDLSTCTCSGAQYSLNSNDLVANDGTYTRGFAVVSNVPILSPKNGITVGTGSTLATDCVAKVKHQFPAIVDLSLGQSVPFKIEAVDKEGNLTTWPTKPTATFQQTTFSCTGDDCACCVMFSNNPGAECHGRDGVTGIPGSGFENGFCKTFF